jgi:hypothetical protein
LPTKYCRIEFHPFTADLFLLQRLIVWGLQMFNASNPECYVGKFRPRVFGYKNNPDFAKGVVSERVMDNQPQFLKGGTGAQSNIIPSGTRFWGSNTQTTRSLKC